MCRLTGSSRLRHDWRTVDRRHATDYKINNMIRRPNNKISMVFGKWFKKEMPKVAAALERDTLREMNWQANHGWLLKSKNQK